MVNYLYGNYGVPFRNFNQMRPEVQTAFNCVWGIDFWQDEFIVLYEHKSELGISPTLFSSHSTCWIICK